jgi:hypothetical protein
VARPPQDNDGLRGNLSTLANLQHLLQRSDCPTDRFSMGFFSSKGNSYEHHSGANQYRFRDTEDRLIAVCQENAEIAIPERR